MRNSLNIKILDVDIKISIEDKEFLSYLSSVFEEYKLETGEGQTIVSSFEWQDEFLKKNKLALKKEPGFKNIGPNILLSNEKNNIRFLKKIHGRRLKADFIIESNRIRQSLFCHRKTLKEFMERLKKKPKHIDFFEISYFLLYYPFFWYLENMKNIYSLHASCVDTPKGGVLMAGLPGSGKSVTSLSLWKKGKGNLISDNIVLYDDKNAYPCPEPIRLHEEGEMLIGKERLRRIDIPGGKSSKGFYMVEGNKGASSIPRVFLLIGLSDEYSVEELSNDSAANMAFSQSIQGAEILNYFEYASLLNFLDEDKKLFEKRLETLKTLFKNMKCFKLSIPRGQDVTNKILDLL